MERERESPVAVSPDKCRVYAVVFREQCLGLLRMQEIWNRLKLRP